MTINELIEKAHATARDKGWWEEGKLKSPVECLALVHSEISEAIEEIRKGLRDTYFKIPDEATKKVLFDELRMTKNHIFALAKAGFKPEGEAIELADAVLRIADYCGYHKIDLVGAIEAKMLYNDTRSYRHGNKKY